MNRSSTASETLCSQGIPTPRPLGPGFLRLERPYPFTTKLPMRATTQERLDGGDPAAAPRHLFAEAVHANAIQGQSLVGSRHPQALGKSLLLQSSVTKVSSHNMHLDCYRGRVEVKQHKYCSCPRSKWLSPGP